MHLVCCVLGFALFFSLIMAHILWSDVLHERVSHVCVPVCDNDSLTVTGSHGRLVGESERDIMGLVFRR